MKFLLTVALMPASIYMHAQAKQQKNYFPAYTYHKDGANITGLSVGLFTPSSRKKITNTNGVKLELIGIGILIPLAPNLPAADSDSSFNLAKKEPLNEKINGLNLSALGAICHCQTNGLVTGLIAQTHFKVNGVSATAGINFVQVQNGLMLATYNYAYKINGLQVGIANNSYKTNGIQFGFFNTSKKLKGLQFGLWNVNQKRKLPLINWNFKA